VERALRQIYPAGLLVFTVCPGNLEPDDEGSYESVTIGGMTWMKNNLNIRTADSWCYDDDPANCAIYGRLYTLEAAKKACPSGWHLPSREEWGALAVAAGGTGDYGAGGEAGKALKSRTGWDSNPGTDTYGFSALPGGYRAGIGDYRNAGLFGSWFTSTEGDGGYVYHRRMNHFDNRVDEFFHPAEDAVGGAISVRCLRD
jgi:uncharacterized protein (TIGR02145 family)